MDEHRAPYRLQAPASSGSSLRLPGRGSFPGIEDHLVVPEVTRDEIIGGRRVVASPAQPPYAVLHGRLGYVLGALVAPGFILALDLLTRHDEESDFASDACIYKEGIDPATGVRYLEEIAFEVVSEQNARDVTEKALRMHRHGVRRIFTVWVKGGLRVCEWSPESRSWSALAPSSRIQDPCLAAPLTVAALLDAVSADYAVVDALSAKGSPALLSRDSAVQAQGKAEGLAQGKEEGLAPGKEEGLALGRATGIADSILNVLDARRISVSEMQRDEILRCRDLDQLDRWLRRAALASSAEEITSDL